MRLPTRSVLLAAATTALVATTSSAYAVSPGAVGRDAPARAGVTAYGWTVTPTGTTDGGRTWGDVSPQGLGTAALEFRDIEAFDARHAVILSIGEGEDSRILVTDDGGATWTESFRNTDPAAFYDCMAFSSPRRGLAMSDPVDGRFRLVQTSDGGRSWTPVDPAGMPAAQAGEFAFAASGTCLSSGVGGRTYLVSGGVDPARVFTSRPRPHVDRRRQSRRRWCVGRHLLGDLPGRPAR